MFQFDLGDIVADSITGFKGVVIGRTEWLNGCIRYSVQSKVLKENKPLEPEAFDEQQLFLVEKAKPKEIENRTGGPRQDASRRADVSRF